MGGPRIGVVGTGWWATNHHVPSLIGYDGAELVAVCDVRSDRAAEVARQAGVQIVVSSIGELVGLVDAVVVATPHATHHRLAREALDAGLHVLVEKPLAVTAAQAWDLVSVAESHGLHLSVGYTYQYAEAARFVREAVRSGGIGDLVQVNAEFASGTRSLFAAAERQADPRSAGDLHPASYSAEHGGGQAHTQITHVMGMVCWATGHEVDEVFAYVDHSGLAIDVTDVAAFRLRGGGLGTCGSTGMAGPGQARHRVRYFGTEGLIEQDLLRGAARLIANDGSVRSREPAPSTPAYPTWQPARSFADLIAGRGENQAPGRDAAAAVAFCEALLRSGASGRPETVVPGPTAKPMIGRGLARSDRPTQS